MTAVILLGKGKRVHPYFSELIGQAYHFMSAAGFPYLDTQEMVTSWPSLSVRAVVKIVPPYSNRGFRGFTENISSEEGFNGCMESMSNLLW